MLWLKTVLVALYGLISTKIVTLSVHKVNRIDLATSGIVLSDLCEDLLDWLTLLKQERRCLRVLHRGTLFLENWRVLS